MNTNSPMNPWPIIRMMALAGALILGGLIVADQVSSHQRKGAEKSIPESIQHLEAAITVASDQAFEDAKARISAARSLEDAERDLKESAGGGTALLMASEFEAAKAEERELATKAKASEDALVELEKRLRAENPPKALLSKACTAGRIAKFKLYGYRVLRLYNSTRTLREFTHEDHMDVLSEVLKLGGSFQKEEMLKDTYESEIILGLEARREASYQRIVADIERKRNTASGN